MKTFKEICTLNFPGMGKKGRERKRLFFLIALLVLGYASFVVSACKFNTESPFPFMDFLWKIRLSDVLIGIIGIGATLSTFHLIYGSFRQGWFRKEQILLKTSLQDLGLWYPRAKVNTLLIVISMIFMGVTSIYFIFFLNMACVGGLVFLIGKGILWLISFAGAGL